MESDDALTKQHMELVQEYEDKLTNTQVINSACQLSIGTCVCPHHTTAVDHNLPAMVGEQRIYLKDMVLN